MDIIVVGVDGSKAARAALEFAVGETERRQASLRVIAVWDSPAPPEWGRSRWEEMLETRRGYAEAIVADAVERARELSPDVRIEGVIRDGEAETVLVQEAEGAAIIIVGRRGEGALGGHALGSVSRHVADHAPCPVIVVPPAKEA